MRAKATLLGLLWMLGVPPVCSAADLTGQATVIDGDTIEIHGKQLQIYGVKSPDVSQTCKQPDSTVWPCGKMAAEALAEFLGDETINCVEHDLGEDDRRAAVCYLGDQDVGHWLAQEGWAFADRQYSYEYTGAEMDAQVSNRGLWHYTVEAANEATLLIGQATVIDGDTIEIHGERIRLFGIDAPESGQTCKDADGDDYRCGQYAALALADFILWETVTCEPRDTDRYGSIVAVCWTYMPLADLSAWLVSEGHAMAFRRYSLDYVEDEQHAKEENKGIWRGSLIAPWDWRKGVR